jgi:hypothetical protein
MKTAVAVDAQPPAILTLTNRAANPDILVLRTLPEGYLTVKIIMEIFTSCDVDLQGILSLASRENV